MSVGAIGAGEAFSEGDGRLPRFVVSSLVAHGALLALLIGLGLHLAVPVERPLKVRIVAGAPSSPVVADAPAAGPAVPGAQVGPPDTTPELIETPKPKVEEAPRSKRFAGLYDRRGGPGSKAPVPDARAWTKKAPEEPPRGVTPPALEAMPQPTRVEPIPQGRTALVQPVPPAAAPFGAAPSQGARPSRPSLRDQVASLGLSYRPPVDDAGTPNDPSGRGEAGLDTFRFKYATWGLAVKHDIERAWKVPGYGISSLAIVRFLVLPDGRIRDLALERSSGRTSLDQAATNAINDAAPFRPFPPRMRDENPSGIEIVVNFYYREGRGILEWE